jgi:hypothetical protein
VTGIFTYLQRKSIWRSQRIGAGIAARIFMGFFILYFGAIFLAIGFFFEEFIDEMDADTDPMLVLHQYLLYYLLFELVMRVIFQEVSEVKYRQLALLPVKRTSIIHFILRGTAVSFFNILPLFFIIPFGIRTMAPDFGWLGTISWMFATIGLLLFNNYFALQIKHWVTKNTMLYIVPALVAGGIYLVDSQGLLPISEYFHSLMMAVLKYSAPALLIWALTAFMYTLVHRRMLSQAYVSGDLKTSKPFLESLNFDRLGDKGFFGVVAQLNLKLMFRNKRVRTQVIMGSLFLLYGLIIYNQDSTGRTMYLFWGLYMTGIIALSFAQYLWSYQGAYVELLWTLPIPLKKYLNAQYNFLIVACIATTLPSMLYYFLVPSVPMINGAAFLFNIGINIPFLMMASAYSKKKIDIASAGTFNMQGINGAQFLFVFIVLLAPLFIFAPFAIFKQHRLGYLILGILGIIGLLLKPLLIQSIAKLIQEKKYGLTEGFRSS